MFALKIERTGQLIERRSSPFYVMLGFISACVMAGVAFTPFYFGSGDTIMPLWSFTFIAAAGMVARLYAMPRIADLLASASLLPIVGILTMFAIAMLAALSGPFADSQLAAADSVLGLDWLALHRVYGEHRWLYPVSSAVYASFAFQMALLQLVLVAAGRDIWPFITAWTVALIITTLIFPFFPAEGPYVLHQIPELEADYLKRLFPWQTGPVIDSIRSGQQRDLSTLASGLVSMPSFHAAGAALFIFGAWPVRWLRYPALVLNVAVILSAAIIGAHYLVDLIAGVAVAVVSWLIAVRITRHEA